MANKRTRKARRMRKARNVQQERLQQEAQQRADRDAIVWRKAGK